MDNVKLEKKNIQLMNTHTNIEQFLVCISAKQRA